MKIASFSTPGQDRRLGIVRDKEIVDLAVACPDLPRDMTEFLAAGEPAMKQARAAANSDEALQLSAVKLLAPVPNPPTFLAIGLNYEDHLLETGRERPQFPMFFNKQVTCIVGPYDDVQRPRVSEMLDFEGELGLVIGKECRHVPRDHAHEVIAGYVIVNDVSVRDWQRRAQTMTLGKSFDTHGPMGPWLVTSDEVGDPHDLNFRTTLSGTEVQHSNTKHMLFDCYDQIATLSTAFTLRPGTVISTGTCGGVGSMRKPPLWMKAGDVVRVEFDKLGYIENRIVEEPADSARY